MPKWRPRTWVLLVVTLAFNLFMILGFLTLETFPCLQGCAPECCWDSPIVPADLADELAEEGPGLWVGGNVVLGLVWMASASGLGGFAAVFGGVLMIVSVFLPWFSGWHGAGSVTGWDTYTVRNGFLAKFGIKEAFASGFSPLFTGLSMLVAGGLLALIGLAMLASLRGGAFRLPGAGRAALAVLALLIAIGGVTNLASLYATRSLPDRVTPESGLYLLTAGAIIGLAGVPIGLSKGRS